MAYEVYEQKSEYLFFNLVITLPWAPLCFLCWKRKQCSQFDSYFSSRAIGNAACGRRGNRNAIFENMMKEIVVILSASQWRYLGGANHLYSIILLSVCVYVCVVYPIACGAFTIVVEIYVQACKYTAAAIINHCTFLDMFPIEYVAIISSHFQHLSNDASVRLSPCPRSAFVPI